MNIRPWLSLPLLLLPGLALAHQGHGEHGLLAGWQHPFAGLDHLLAMLAIGVWAALQSRVMKLAIPATFLAALLVGYLLGTHHIELPQMEIGISLSVLLLGLLVASSARLPAAMALVLAASFALFHGNAHGVEASGSVLGFAAGFLLASLVLHLGGGLLVEYLQHRMPKLARVLGTGIAVAGALMMA